MIHYPCSNVLEEQLWWKRLNKTAKEEYLEFILGKKEKYSSIASKALTSYYIVIIFVGMIGNVLTAWVISISPALQTPSNYFLCNLAIVDIVTLLLGKYFYPIFMILFLQFRWFMMIQNSIMFTQFIYQLFRFKSCRWIFYLYGTVTLGFLDTLVVASQ